MNCAGSMAVKNADLDDLSARKKSLQREIALLEYEGSKYSSLKIVEEKAVKMGFIKASGSLISIDLTSGVPIASAVK